LDLEKEVEKMERNPDEEGEGGVGDTGGGEGLKAGVDLHAAVSKLLLLRLDLGGLSVMTPSRVP
jgi:hypothetical protein